MYERTDSVGPLFGIIFQKTIKGTLSIIVTVNVEVKKPQQSLVKL